MIIGIDEVGRGCWAGPVVACSFSFSPLISSKEKKEIIGVLRDSKKLTEKKREDIFEKLIKLSGSKKIYFGVGVVDNYIIDEINIRQANREAMRRSLEEIMLKIGDSKITEILIDGKDNYVFDIIPVKPQFIIKGDDKINEIKASSIIAKVFRDRLMTVYGQLYPQYNFSDNKSYGTKFHIDAINLNGITGIHRKSYKPIKKYL